MASATTRVRVSAMPESGFRRIGMQFTREPKEIDVTSEQLKILKGEKNLVVVDLPPEQDEGKPKDDGKGKPKDDGKSK